MATSKENDLIGYDPLAWMEGDADKSEDHLVQDDIDSGNELDGRFSDNEMTLTDDCSDDLMGNVEERPILNAAKADELTIDEVEVESGSTLIEEEAGCLVDEGVVCENSASEEDESQIDLDSTLTIQNVVKLYEKLKNVLAVHDQIEINASDVSSIDTATLQLLVSLKKDAVKLQKKVTIIYPSPRFVESAKLLGLLDILDVHEL